MEPVKDSFIKRLEQEPRCAIGIVDFDVQKRDSQTYCDCELAHTIDVDHGRLMRFISKYLGEDKKNWNEWFVTYIVDPLMLWLEFCQKRLLQKMGHFLKQAHILRVRNNPYGTQKPNT